MAKGSKISLLIGIQVWVHVVWVSVPVCHGQRATPRTTSASTSSYDVIWTTTSTPRSTTVRYGSTSGGDDEIVNFVTAGGGSTPTRPRTTTTRRPLPDLDSYGNSVYHPSGSTIGGSTTRPPPWQGQDTIRTTTPKNNWQDNRETTRRSTPVPTTNRNRLSVYATSPSVNFTAKDFKGIVFNTTWRSVNGEGQVSVRNQRKFAMTFMCNATYPVEWLSQTPFNDVTWEVEELRHFQEIREESYAPPSSWQPPPSPTIKTETIYTVLLTLSFERSDTVPNAFTLNCGHVGRTFPQNRRTVVRASKDVNETLTVHIFSNVKTWAGAEESQTQFQHRNPLGSNTDCLVHLKWSLDRFECTSEQPHNLTLDYEDKHCYDHASCERRYSDSDRACWATGLSSNLKTIWKIPVDTMWPSSPPPAGVVYCERNDDIGHKERAAALHFFHSLPPICPGDDAEASRLKMYIASNAQLGLDTLSRDFVSFCWTPRSYNETLMHDVAPLVVYVGQNISVTCIASLYHFARGTRIGIVNRHTEFPEYTRVNQAVTDRKIDQGFLNFTGKVHIKSADVTGLVCENYMKQRSDSVEKFIPLVVRVPKNITFRGITELASWNYTGQPGFQLKCDAEGDPPPKITWRKQTRPIPENLQVVETGPSSSVLKFPVLKDSPTQFSVSELHGTYTCEAANELDTNSVTFVVQSSASNTTTIPWVDPSGQSPAESSGGSLWFLWVILPIFVVAVIAVIGFLVWKIKKQSKELRLLSKAEVDEFIFGKPEFLQHHSSSEEVNNYAPFLPYNRGYEVGKEQLEIDENAVLGSGAYAIVLRGVLNRAGGERLRVAIKTARAMDDISLFKALLSELKIMGFIGTHLNIVNLMGAHTKNIQNREIFIAIEFCENGNLLNYLRDHRNRFTNLVDQNGEHDFIPGSLDTVSRASFVSPGNELNTVTLIKWAYEIATGMEFLSQKKVIHGDLAARNILLNEHLTAKIGDFGLSRQLFEYANYIKKQQSPLPWKWLAIECLQDMRFSVKSDIWAYAIMLFEIFSLGQVPYPGHSYNDEFLDALIGGKRPNRPSHATKNIYSFMQTCWKDKSDERPNFSQVRDFFNKLLVTLVPPEYLDLHEKVAAVVLNPVDGNADLHQISVLQSPNQNPGPVSSTGEEEKQSRFSFSINTKTITAMFHRS